MSDFLQSVTDSGINAALLAAGKALITQEAADLAIEIFKAESVPAPTMAFTHCCEASFLLNSKPNCNGHPEGIVCWDIATQKLVSWDIGSYQLNFLWTHRSLAIGEYRMDGLTFSDIWGKTFYDRDGAPADFSGVPLANGRLAARRLMAVKAGGLSESEALKFRAVRFTGPSAQGRRGDLWDTLYGPLVAFFEKYQ